MTKQQIIDEICKDKRYIAICRSLVGGNAKDLLQDLLIIILEKPDKELESINPLIPYIVKVLQNMVYNKRKEYHITYNRKVDDTEYKNYLLTESGYDKSIDTLAAKTNRIIDNLYWYDKEIFKLYLEDSNKTSLSYKTRIPRKSIERTINKVKKEIKIKLKMPIKILLIVQKNTTALQYYRQLMPHERMMITNSNEFSISQRLGESRPDENGVMCQYEPDITQLSDEELKQFSIVYYLRQVSVKKELIDYSLQRLKNLGIKVILDIDDYWQLPKEHHLHYVYKENKMPELTEYTLGKVDWVTTTTDYFADKIESHNTNVTVFPNCINPDSKQFIPRKIESKRMRFGWLGGVYHKEDVKLMAHGINRLYSERELKDKWQICLGGFSANKESLEMESVMSNFYDCKTTDRTYYDYLLQFTPAMEHISYDKEYRRIWGKDIWSYADTYNEIDVALIPLKDNEFNKCKSELKIIEAGWMKKAIIVSDITPYKEFIVHGKNGLVVNPSRNNIDWFVNMRKLILNPNMVEDLAGALHETIKLNFDMDEINKERAELYKSLI